MGKSSLNKLWSQVAAFIVPKTPRGRVWQAVVFILLLFVFTGNLSEPKYWNAMADKVNSVVAPSEESSLRVPDYWNVPFKLGLDLQGGTHLVYTADMSSIPEEERSEAMAGVRDVIERRVNAFGVSEPLVQVDRSGDLWRLIVDLAGITDISDAIKQIGETPILEFKELNDEPPREMTDVERQEMEDYNDAARKTANEVLGKVRMSGSDFSALAAEYSEDENSKDRGGDIGFVTPGSPYYGLAAEVAGYGNLVQGEVLSDVIELNGSLHIVKYISEREAGDEIKAKHILICYDGAERCTQTRSKEEARQIAAEIADQVDGTNFSTFAGQKSDDSGSAAQGGDLGWFGRGTMVADFDNAAFGLKDGEISGVVETPFGFHVILREESRVKTEYELAHIMFDLKTPAEMVPPPDQWKNTELSGKHLSRSSLQFNQQTGEPHVALEFNDEGKGMFADITERNVGQPVAIFLDGSPISIPTVNEPIYEGSAVITGGFTIPEAKTLARRLNAGALPVPINLETQTSVGASLGQESLYASLRAGLIGFVIVAAFMLLYYRLPGLIAVLALLLYTVTNLAVFKLVGVTLTLSGIAGFILSVGMAVDANILIFERLKEELKRGRTMQSAIDEGFRRAWNSIRDSNFTTLISCTILYFTSSSLIKGFALTLALGVVISMFSAITVSRTLLKLVSGWKIFQSPPVYLPGFNRMPKPDEDDNKKKVA